MGWSARASLSSPRLMQSNPKSPCQRFPPCLAKSLRRSSSLGSCRWFSAICSCAEGGPHDHKSSTTEERAVWSAGIPAPLLWGGGTQAGRAPCSALICNHLLECRWLPALLRHGSPRCAHVLHHAANPPRQTLIICQDMAQACYRRLCLSFSDDANNEQRSITADHGSM